MHILEIIAYSYALVFKIPEISSTHVTYVCLPDKVRYSGRTLHEKTTSAYSTFLLLKHLLMSSDNIIITILMPVKQEFHKMNRYLNYISIMSLLLLNGQHVCSF